MARLLVLGIVALAFGGACGQTARDQPKPSAVAGAGGAGADGAGAGSAPGGAGAGQLAGAAGRGGTPPELSAVAECEQYCEGLEYRLPSALCEDWNSPQWEPEFCGVTDAESCADYCTKVYETVSSECAVALPAVVRCVAPTYASIGISPIDDCWLGNCRQQLYTMTSACYGLREKLAAARALWDASGVTEYRLQYDWGSDETAQVLVQSGSEPTVTPPDAAAWTVPKLFDEVQRYLEAGGVAPDATYHPDLGYVVSLALLEGCTQAPQVVSAVEVTPLR